MIKTTYEKGIEEGIEKSKAMIKTTHEKGVEEGKALSETDFLVIVLKEKFGSVSQRARKKIKRMTHDERKQLARRIVTAQSRADLGL